MKRIVLFFFTLIIGGLMAMPSMRPQAMRDDKTSTRRSRRAHVERSLKDPHLGFLKQVDRVKEISRATEEVASKLPERRKSHKSRKSTVVPLGPSPNIIDQELFKDMAAQGIKPAEPASDEEFCRRLYLDLIGKPPTPDELLGYVNDPNPAKKEKLIESLLGRGEFVARWTNWLGDLVRSFPNSFDTCDRNVEYRYLRDAVQKNAPLTEIARGLIAAEGHYCSDPDKSIVGTAASFLARPLFSTDEYPENGYDDLGAEVARAFLGVPAVCVSCHNGAGHLEYVNLYLSRRTRREFWQYAAFFAGTGLDVPEDDLEYVKVSLVTDPDGEYQLYGQGGMRPPRRPSSGELENVARSYKLFGLDSPGQGLTRRDALTNLIIDDPQFSRAFVNRMFAHFFTLGLVEPLDGFDLARLDPDNPPPDGRLQTKHPLLLRALADIFRSDYKFDIRRLMSLMVSSDVYALSSRYDETWRSEYTEYYARKLVRPLQAEEVFDLITTSTQMTTRYESTPSRLDPLPPVDSVMGLPGPGEPYAILSTIEDNVSELLRLLQEFGQGNRNTIQRTKFGSIGQAFIIFNSNLLNNRLVEHEGLPAQPRAIQIAEALKQGKMSAKEAVAALFLETVARQPAEAEVSYFTGRIASSSNLKRTIGDIHWTLLNRVDCIYNY